MSFHVHAENYDKDFTVSVPKFDTDFLLLFIPNKEGDNCVILTRARYLGEDWSTGRHGMDIQKLKRKWNANLKAPDILNDAGPVQEEQEHDQ